MPRHESQTQMAMPPIQPSDWKDPESVKGSMQWLFGAGGGGAFAVIIAGYLELSDRAEDNRVIDALESRIAGLKGEIEAQREVCSAAVKQAQALVAQQGEGFQTALTEMARVCTGGG